MNFLKVPGFRSRLMASLRKTNFLKFARVKHLKEIRLYSCFYIMFLFQALLKVFKGQ